MQLDIEQLKKVKLSNTEYRSYLINTLKSLENFPPIVTIEQAIEMQRLLFEVIKELYKIDSR